MGEANRNMGGLVESLNAKVYGNGTQTIVLSHGFGSDQTVWHLILPYLLSYFKVVVFDMAFSGKVKPDFYDENRYSSYESYSKDLQNLLDELNLKDTIYLGHSISAMVGCIAATERPELFKHLVLLNGSPRYLNDEDYNGGFERSDIESLLNDMEKDFNGWATNFAPYAVGVENDISAIQEFTRSLRAMEPGTAVEVARTIFLGDYRHVLEEVKVPCTVIQSEKDIVVPISVPAYMETKLGGPTKVEILKTEGHLPHLTATTLVMNVLNTVLCINPK